MDTSPLSQLPLEILSTIIAFLGAIKDRKSLRFTCRSLNSIMVPWVFHDVYIFVDSFLERQNAGQEGFPQLVNKYGHLMKSLEVDGLDVDGKGRLSRCPLEVHPFLLRLPNLRSLSLSGDNSATSSYSSLHVAAYKLFEQASLQAPSQSHVFQHLRSCK